MNNRYMERLKAEVPLLHNQYNRLLFIFESKSDYTLKIFSQEYKIPYININLYLSEKLKEVPLNKRTFRAIAYMNELVKGDSEILSFDYYEILFDSSLRLNVFDIFKNLSRNKTLLVSWRGVIEQGFLVHAIPGHSEYKRESIAGMKIIY